MRTHTCLFHKLVASWRWRFSRRWQRPQRPPYAARCAQLMMLKAHHELWRLLAAHSLVARADGVGSMRSLNFVESRRACNTELAAEEVRLARMHLLYVEQEMLEALWQYGMIDRVTARERARNIDAQLRLLKPSPRRQ